MAGEETMFFGKIAQLNGMISSKQLKECLFIQEKLHHLGLDKKIGEILLMKKYISPNEVHDILTLQEAKFKRAQLPDKDHAPPPKNLCNFGTRVIRNSLLPHKQVEECMKVRDKLKTVGIRLRLADIMLQRGYLSGRAIEAVLNVQRKEEKRKLRVLLAVACGILAVAAIASAIIKTGLWRSEETAQTVPLRKPSPVQKGARTAPPRKETSSPARIEKAAKPAATGESQASAPPMPESPPETQLEERIRESEKALFPPPPRVPGEEKLFLQK